MKTHVYVTANEKHEIVGCYEMTKNVFLYEMFVIEMFAMWDIVCSDRLLL